MLELLTDEKQRNIIRWKGVQGEFELVNRKKVAHQWGAFKGNKDKSYESLARSLRDYYHKDDKTILKVPGEPFVYKFVRDLKQLMGYDAKELTDMVNGVHRRPGPRRRYPNGYPK